FVNELPIPLHIHRHETAAAQHCPLPQHRYPAGRTPPHGQDHVALHCNSTVRKTAQPATDSSSADGTSYGWISNRPSRSAASMSAAPSGAISATARRRLSPVTSRTRLGATSPIKGIPPAVTTTLPTIIATSSTPAPISRL